MTASDAEAGLIAACLAPYWQAEWGLLDIVVESLNYKKQITRQQFNALIEPIVERTLKPCRQALQDAKSDQQIEARSHSAERGGQREKAD